MEIDLDPLRSDQRVGTSSRSGDMAISFLGEHWGHSRPEYKFLDEKPLHIPMPLQPSFLCMDDLLAAAWDLPFLTMQSVHVARALYHTLICYAMAAPEESELDCRFLDICSELCSHVDDLDDLFEEMDTTTHELQPPLTQWQTKLDRLFTDLEQAGEDDDEVRRSSRTMSNLKAVDWRQYNTPGFDNRPVTDDDSAMQPSHIVELVSSAQLEPWSPSKPASSEIDHPAQTTEGSVPYALSIRDEDHVSPQLWNRPIFIQQDPSPPMFNWVPAPDIPDLLSGMPTIPETTYGLFQSTPYGSRPTMESAFSYSGQSSGHRMSSTFSSSMSPASDQSNFTFGNRQPVRSLPPKSLLTRKLKPRHQHHMVPQSVILTPMPTITIPIPTSDPNLLGTAEEFSSLDAHLQPSLNGYYHGKDQVASLQLDTRLISMHQDSITDGLWGPSERVPLHSKAISNIQVSADSQSPRLSRVALPSPAMARELHGNKDDLGASQITETGLKGTVYNHLLSRATASRRRADDDLISISFRTEEDWRRRAVLDNILASKFLGDNVMEPNNMGPSDPLTTGMGAEGKSIYAVFLEEVDRNEWRCLFGDKEHPCGSQAISFKRLERALDHVRSHLNHRPFVCKGECQKGYSCGARFFARSHLQDHVKRTESVCCETCGQFICIQNMPRHRLVHQ